MAAVTEGAARTDVASPTFQHVSSIRISRELVVTYVGRPMVNRTVWGRFLEKTTPQ
jgi:hypothetical protein